MLQMLHLTELVTEKEQRGKEQHATKNHSHVDQRQQSNVARHLDLEGKKTQKYRNKYGKQS